MQGASGRHAIRMSSTESISQVLFRSSLLILLLIAAEGTPAVIAVRWRGDFFIITGAMKKKERDS
jgi:hypothetical protein